MTDTHDDVPERKDPVLVRPYIGAGAGAEPEVWPESATLPEPEVTTEPVAEIRPKEATPPAPETGEDRRPTPSTEANREAADVPEPDRADPAETAVLPVVPADPDPRSADPADPELPRRAGFPLAQRLLVLGGGVVLALGVGAYLVFGGGGDSGRQPGTALPAYTGGVPTAAVTGTPRPSGSVSASPSASASASLSASASISASASVSVSASVSASISPPTSAPASAPASPAEPTLEPAPGADRTGTITAASGRCLNLGGLLGIDGSPVQVAGCLGGAAQRFTLATDGTLRVGTRCAQTTGDGTVRVTGCDDRAGAQWRSGPSGTLVNPASGTCLTDPGRAGATTTTTACTGNTDQTWSLP